MGMYMSMPHPHQRPRPRTAAQKPKQRTSPKPQPQPPAEAQPIPTRSSLKTMSRNQYDWPPPTFIYTNGSFYPTDRFPCDSPSSSRPYYATPQYFSTSDFYRPPRHREYSNPPRDAAVTLSSSGTPEMALHVRHHSDDRPRPEPMSFRGAAQQLDLTLRKASEYFGLFYAEYCRETKALGKYAEGDLKKNIWLCKIRFAASNPSAAAASIKNKPGNNGGNNCNGSQYNNDNNNYNGYGNNNNNNNNNSNTQQDALNQSDVPKFEDLRKAVIEHCEAACHSIIPHSSSRNRPHHPSAPVSPIRHDVKMSDAQNADAERLLGKLRRWKNDLLPHMQGLDHDASAAKMAVNEMKDLLGYMETYKRAWKEGWEDVESDDEGDGEGVGVNGN